MSKYFKDGNTLEELRRQYKELLKKYHPDNTNGSTEATQDINAEYDPLFKVLKDKHEKDQTDNNNEKTRYNDNMYNWENDKAMREVLEKIINLVDIDILICGQWIWVSGNTYQYKKELKEIGFKWASKKKMWHFHTDIFKKKSKKVLSMEEIKSYYGSTKIETNSIQRLQQAQTQVKKQGVTK